MNNEVLNDEFLKSIDSNYEFSNKPIRRLKKSQQPGEIKLQLENLKKQIAEIDACDLKNHANQLVFSDGNFRSKIMLVGEGPGQKEDETGKPFMGDAGKLLNKMLAAIDIKRESIYITNVVNYRPPNNRKPTNKEIVAKVEALTRVNNIVIEMVDNLGNSLKQYIEYKKDEDDFMKHMKEQWEKNSDKQRTANKDSE